MPVWVAIIIAVVGALVGVAGGVGITAYLSERLKHKAQRKNDKEDKAYAELEEAKDKKTLEQITIAVEAVIAPLIKDTSEIKADLALNTKGTVTILRNDMKKSLDYCKRQGYASSSDRANWHELYNTYGELGGNHFKEFVDAWKAELDALPTAPVEKKKLNEDK